MQIIPETDSCYELQVKPHEDGILFYCEDVNVGLFFDKQQAELAIEALQQFVEAGEVK
ncbi:hypothetical protein [Lonsdalea quercina]|uniref:hypothetical protein n=1 Tax=Lonsdalea quercina TaxID=71657 RepID=UPI00397597E8